MDKNCSKDMKVIIVECKFFTIQEIIGMRDYKRVSFGNKDQG